METMNPVVAILAFVIALVGGGGGATIFTALINRKAQSATRTKTLEEASASFRNEVQNDNSNLKTQVADIKTAVIALTDILDDLLPKMITALDMDEKMRLREAVTKAKLAA